MPALGRAIVNNFATRVGSDIVGVAFTVVAPVLTEVAVAVEIADVPPVTKRLVIDAYFEATQVEVAESTAEAVDQ